MVLKLQGEGVVFSARCCDRRNRADLMKSRTQCHDAQVVGPYQVSNPFSLAVLTSRSEDYNIAPQHLQVSFLLLRYSNDLNTLWCIWSLGRINKHCEGNDCNHFNSYSTKRLQGNRVLNPVSWLETNWTFNEFSYSGKQGQRTEKEFL